MKTIVIGAGPAGMMAALQAARSSEVLLLEKNATPGKKLLLSGGGRCNITTAVDDSTFLESINDGRFFRPALRAFSRQALLAFFEDRGLSFKQEGKKYYPTTDSARSVLQVLIEALQQSGVVIRTHADVRALELYPERFKVTTGQAAYTSERLILASGGASYPGSGSDGQILEYLKQNGISVTTLQAGLCGLYTQDPITALSGVSLPDVELRYGARRVRGELLFTHHGLSGPAAIDFSSELPTGPFVLQIDFLPKQSEVELMERLFRPEAKSLSTLLGHDLPKRVAQLLVQAYEPGDRFNFTRQKRRALVEHIKQYPVQISHKGSLKQAMITVGGVDLGQISARTMEHKHIKGLYLAGEMLNLHGPSGGYNLQIAFSTGFLAGHSIGAYPQKTSE